jgi:hypothetical protein
LKEEFGTRWAGGLQASLERRINSCTICSLTPRRFFTFFEYEGRRSFQSW